MVTLSATEHALTRPATDTTSSTEGLNLSGKFHGFLKHLATAYAVSMERRQLLKLTDSQLADIGVTRSQVLEESRRAFFDIPNR